MTDHTVHTEEKIFAAEIDKQGRAFCKHCKQKCLQGELRIAKLAMSPGVGKIKTWFHPNCIFEVFTKQRLTTKKIESYKDIEGWEALSETNRKMLFNKIEDFKESYFTAKSSKIPRNNKPKNVSKTITDTAHPSSTMDEAHKDNSFRYFRKTVSKISGVNSSSEKINIFQELFNKGSDGTGFKGDPILWCKLLLPGVIKNSFGLQTDQVIYIFSKIFKVSEISIREQCEQGDLGQTIHDFFERNKDIKPAKNSTLALPQVEEFLSKLNSFPNEMELIDHFRNFMESCTLNDLKVVIRLIKHDLKMRAGAKIVLQGYHPDAYAHFDLNHDIKAALKACLSSSPSKEKNNDNKSICQAINKEKLPKKRKLSTSTKSGKKSKPSTEDDSLPPDTTVCVNTLESNIESEINKSNESLDQGATSVPTYFMDVKLLLDDGVMVTYSEWVRYFTAYGGTVVKPKDCMEATHVLHLDDTIFGEPTIECAKSARHVRVEWIEDTVKKESLQDTRIYCVRWLPERKEIE